jgi:serine/threonine protein kinase/dienelactone hydrolase
MKCPKCQADILDDSQFCSKCGTPIHPGDQAFLSHTHTILRPIDELVPGTELAGKYKIIDVVGKGGMGIVYKAEDIKLKRNVALKFLPPELTKDKEAKERFVLEAQAAAALSHPNICTIHEINEEEGKSFIAMEYVEGLSLKNKIDRGPVDIEEAVDIAIQVAQGMEQAHKKGIIHRDIKSANIMVTDMGQAKIMDFGLAKVKGGTLLTREGTTLGTVAYMSPEQARGQEVDHRSDIWSLGIVMYEMLSGQLPFMGDREASILYSVVHEEPKPVTAWNPDIPPQLQQIVDHALKKKPEARYQSAADLLKDLQKYKDTLKAEELGALSLRSLLRKIRRPIVAIPALILIATISVAAVWFLNRQSKIRYARQELLPEIERIINETKPGAENYYDAYKQLLEVEKIIPKEPKFIELLSSCIINSSIQTDPPGAKIFMKKYSEPNSDWEFLGISPLEKIRLPRGNFRWKMEKEGYETVLAVSATFDFDLSKQGMLIPYTIKRTLDKKESIPPGMVRVTGEKVEYKNIGDLPDFYIDRYEATNAQFKEFIENGGYQTTKYWTYEFLKEGKKLSWEESMAEFVDQTGRPGPSTWYAGDYPEGKENFPVSGVSWYEAAAYAKFKGKSLPTGIHWSMARGSWTPMAEFSGLFSVLLPMSNLNGEKPAAVGSFKSMDVYGTYDMAGNVREWCWNQTEKGRIIRGGAWNDFSYMYGNWTQASSFDRSEKNGFRCSLYLEPEKLPDTVFESEILEEEIDFYSQTSVPDDVFDVYKNQFSYDKTDLNAEVESKDDSAEDWVQEKITFDAAYENERMILCLFLPKNASPPYQTIIYFPGSGSVYKNSSENIAEVGEFKANLAFLIKNGRAVAYPIYKGTFERGDPKTAPIHSGDNSHLYTQYLIKLVQDLKRSIDYLETREDIDTEKLAYFGFSWGGQYGAIIPAVEERLKISIIKVGGMWGEGRPEVNEINYVTRVKIPTLMLNGEYDMTFPFETTVKPMYDLLGTPDEHKVLKTYPTDHFIPMSEQVREVLAWLEKYFGRPKK